MSDIDKRPIIASFRQFRARAERWSTHMHGSARGEGRGLYFACPCGFSVLQSPVRDSFPDTFVKAVNEHLRAIVVEEGNHTPHLTVVGANAS